MTRFSNVGESFAMVAMRYLCRVALRLAYSAGRSDMKQLGLRISLTAAVASLAASFPSVASVHSDDADGTELRSQHADEATWSLLMFPHAPACLLSASEPGLDVLRVMTVPGTSTQAEGVVHPPTRTSLSEANWRVICTPWGPTLMISEMARHTQIYGNGSVRDLHCPRSKARVSRVTRPNI